MRALPLQDEGMRLRGIWVVLLVVLSATARHSVAQQQKPTRDNFKTAADGVTKGWLLEYQMPGTEDDPAQSWRRFAGKLVIVRHGHVVRQIAGASDIKNWSFWNGAREVVYETGPVFFGDTGCLRVDVRTGKTLETWQGDCREVPAVAPAWVKAANGNSISE
jgi:hypothetical protein